MSSQTRAADREARATTMNDEKEESCAIRAGCLSAFCCAAVNKRDLRYCSAAAALSEICVLISSD